jgi:4-aminobutyrate aminotransferase/diaminobutyrate-pyruvate transaminase/4-aminobutyrate aminotransferase/(S)-3-amino-2-methylpropionate transaminase
MTGMPPILWHEADGFLVHDAYGNQWIDLTSGIVVANAGHSHPRILDAIRKATDRRLLATYAFPSQARLELLEKLVALSPIPDSKAILFCAGTEATECAMTVMRRHGRQIHRDKTGILSFEGSFHGRTLAASFAGGSAQPSDWIERGQVQHFQIPFPDCPRCPWERSQYDECGEACFRNCLESLARRGIGAERIAGMILEPVPGCTTRAMPSDFAAAMAEWARGNDVLIAFDEIQCGCGRTGKLFAGEHLDVVPDLIALGKGLTSSLPVSAVIAGRELLDLATPGEMSSTHGGNPVCAAAALANLEVIEEENLVEASRKTGAQVVEKLRSWSIKYPDRVRSIDGLGLFISIHLSRPGDGQPDVELADAIATEAVRRGVLMFTTGRGYLKITPPLSIDVEAALEAADVVQQCFQDLT